MSAVPPAVERGAEYLDARWPGWEANVNLDRLDLSQGDCCILGQLYGDYDDALPGLGLSQRDAVRLGFMPRGQSAYKRLTAWWAWLIAERRTP